MTANSRILQRLLAALDRFEACEPDDAALAALQGAVVGHGMAVELGPEWLDLVNELDGAIETARFATPRERQRAAIRPHLDRLRRAIGSARAEGTGRRGRL